MFHVAADTIGFYCQINKCTTEQEVVTLSLAGQVIGGGTEVLA